MCAPAVASSSRSDERCEQVSASPNAHPDQLTALYAEHSAALLSFVTRLTSGDLQWAEDVVQETLLRAWRSNVPTGEGHPPVRSWLFTVARRIVIDSVRRRAARPSEIGNPEVLEYIPDADRIDEVLTSMAVSDALASLSPAHRDVLNEVYFRGSKIDEAAQALGIAAGTVKSRTYYALRALRLALEERGLTAEQ
jgi:RNA polymerase sigma-70 factor (ECF subfamily)